ncbi:MAG: bifunctional oligoribonuclease/PAP phosphatase NrnA [Clostridiales bacterium]|jgi:phosphoesterase, recJ-like protein|nr:bifunctional oligoribonuclease/PAP phosphatase NrnA [Clostridiales bacterium]
MQDWKQVQSAIAEAGNVLLLPHIHADGDCLGSAFGLAYFLCGKGISVEIISEEKPPENLSFVYRSGKMPANMLFSVWDPQNAEKISKYDLAIAVDTSDEKRLGSRKDLFYQAEMQIRIDHHISEDSFAPVTVCNTSWAATAEGIWELIQTYEDFAQSPYRKEIAECIYTGILTDTGCFAYSNVTSGTHRIAAELMDVAGNMAWQYSEIYENQKKSEIALKAIAYRAVEYYGNGTIAFLCITREEMNSVEATDDDLESFASFLRCIENVSVGIFVKPGNKAGVFRISLRSDVKCDVAAVASQFGGGGHKRAAGFVYNETEDVPFAAFKRHLIGEILKWME